MEKKIRVKLARDDKNSNYKVSLKNIKKEKEFVKLLGDYNIEYKKTEYFKDFFMYNLKNINSKFIMLLQEKASNYIAYIEIKVTLAYETELDFYQNGEYIKSDIKIRSFSENGKNLIRKFEADIERGEKLELYSNSNVEKKYTLIIEKI